MAMQHNPSLSSELDWVVRFTRMCGASRATYFRIKAKLAVR